MTDAQPSIDEADWIDTDAPAEGQLVQVRAQDGHGFYVLPFVVIFRDDEWWNARTPILRATARAIDARRRHAVDAERPIVLCDVDRAVDPPEGRAPPFEA
jgi:hypothetical protein